MKVLKDNKASVGKWYRKELSGGIASNGKPYSITFKKGSINKLMVFFIGGGMSWDNETANKPITVKTMLTKKPGYYLSSMPPLLLKLMSVGLLAEKDKRNPFSHWHILTIPYATADFHLGNNDFSYQDGNGHDKVLRHQGAGNVKQALNFLQETLPETPESLLIAGVSAGGWGCVAHAPAIHRLYPECRQVAICVDGSYLPSSKWPEILQDTWKADPELMSHLKSDDLLTDLLHYAKGQLPENAVFLHAMSAYDVDLTRFLNKMTRGRLEVSSEVLEEFNTGLISTISTLKRSLPNYHYYLTDYGKNKKTGTTPHIFLGEPGLLYSKMQDGISIVDWLLKGIFGDPIDVGTHFLDETKKAKPDDQ